jgi:hypothetical protein
MLLQDQVVLREIIMIYFVRMIEIMREITLQNLIDQCLEGRIIIWDMTQTTPVIHHHTVCITHICTSIQWILRCHLTRIMMPAEIDQMASCETHGPADMPAMIIVDQINNLVALGGETCLTPLIQAVTLLGMDDCDDCLVEVMGKIPHEQPPRWYMFYVNTSK